MQQQPPSEPIISPSNVTTELIQKCLEENKQLILAILDLNSLGKNAEIAPYQARLQNNLTFLASVADAQPPEQTSSQVSPQTAALQQELQGQSLQTILSQPPQTQQNSPNPAFQMSGHPVQQQNVLSQAQTQQHSPNLAFQMSDHSLQQQPLQNVLSQPQTQQHSVFQMSDPPLQQQQQHQPHYHQQHQLNHTEMGIRLGSGSTGNVFQAMQTGLGNPFMGFAGSRQSSLGAGDGHGKSVYEHMDGDAQNMRLM